ncbi:MAG: YfhO family protein, partial [Clostridiales bacterium]|nr:YfhO family protein [Clostridiales bacterium]
SINAGFGIGAAGVGRRDNYMADLNEVKAAVSEVMRRVPATAPAAASSAAMSLPQGGGVKVGGPAPNAPFFRVEFLKDTVSNTPSLYHYRGASYFSSTAVLKVTDLMDKLGFRPSSAWYIYKGSTPVVNSLLSLRYLLSKEETYDNPLYPLVDEINGIRVYENPYQLPLGFVTNSAVLSWDLRQDDVFEIQNDFIRKSTGLGAEARDVLRSAAILHKESRNAEITEQTGNTYRFRVLNTAEPGFINFTVPTAPGAAFTPASDAASPAAAFAPASDAAPPAAAASAPPDAAASRRAPPLYLYIRSRQVDYVWYIKGGSSEGHSVKNYPYIIDTQYFGDADEVEISLKFEENFSGEFEIYGSFFDEEAFRAAYEKLSAQPLVLDTFTDTELSGTFRAAKPGLLFTTIPDDRGWSVRLDGKPVPPDEVLSVGEGFLALRVGPGEHRVTFSYMPPNFLFGLALSLLSAMLTVALPPLRSRRRASVARWDTDVTRRWLDHNWVPLRGACGLRATLYCFLCGTLV